MSFCNYRGNWGYWSGRVTGRDNAGTATAAQRQAAINQFNGVFVTNGYGSAGGPALGFPGVSRPSVRLASVTDGTSNSVAFSEVAHGLLSQTDGNPSSFDNWNWWASGTPGDCSYFHFWPVNPQKKMANLGQDDQAGAYAEAASSFHPGGVNVAMVDGSVRFIKDKGLDKEFTRTVGRDLLGGSDAPAAGPEAKAAGKRSRSSSTPGVRPRTDADIDAEIDATLAAQLSGTLDLSPPEAQAAAQAANQGRLDLSSADVFDAGVGSGGGSAAPAQRTGAVPRPLILNTDGDSARAQTAR